MPIIIEESPAAVSKPPPLMHDLQRNSKVSFRFHRPRRGPWIQIGSLAGYEHNRIELAISDLPDTLVGVRMLHLSDLHLRRRWRKQLDEIIQQTHEAPPDLILFTGDFVDDKRDHRTALPLVERLVRSLQSRHGIFAVCGNHDGDLLEPRLSSWGVRTITHRRADVQINGAPLELIGFPGADRTDLTERFIRSLPPRRNGVPRIILCHYPDLVLAARSLHPDLYLAGHTHGGQMCLPSEGALMTHDTLPRGMCKGAHDVHGTCLFVNRGFGFTTIPARIFCPAEVVEIVLRKDVD